MITRTKLKERPTRKKKILKLIKRFLIVFSVFVFIFLIVESFNRANAIAISNTHYDCQLKGCDYSFTVKNSSNSPVKGYARITVFKAFNIPGLTSDEVLSTERIEFVLKATG
ncbi:MAG: putative membrane protein [Polaribacter sp.]|jgi:uncharacterized membrane protein